MFGLSQSDIEEIKDVLKLFPQVHEALIFGSRALGTQKKGSDIDIAIKGEHLRGCVEEISAILNEKSMLPYFFDILEYAEITNKNLLDHIDRVGVVFYTQTH